LLLAYLAFYPKRIHAVKTYRNALGRFRRRCGRTSLRTALASLRRQLELCGTPAGSFLIADRANVRINPDTITTDVAEFEYALKPPRKLQIFPKKL
jgi:DNA-binding SARP family transcriptional activator